MIQGLIGNYHARAENQMDKKMDNSMGSSISLCCKVLVIVQKAASDRQSASLARCQDTRQVIILADVRGNALKRACVDAGCT